MTRSTLLRVAPIAMVAMAAGLGAYACIDSTAPLQSGGRTATLVITPAFTMEGAPSVVPPKKAHVIITRTTGEVALDTSVVLSSASIGAPGLNQVQLASVVAPITVIVPLAASGVEDFAVRLALLSATGNVVFQGGPVNLRGDPAASALGTIQEVYVGTGATASSVTVTPGTVSLALGGTTTFTAHALSASGAELPGTPVQWTSLDPSIATFPDAASGRVVAGAAPGTAHIRATLLTGRTANATLVVQPSATSIAVQSGNGQSGLPGTAAAAPLVVIARAADGSGIAGVNVTFAIQSGGGSLSATQRTTGSDGSASVNFTFGPNPGPVVITASSAGLGGSPLTFNLAVLAGTPTQVSFTTQPTSGFVGTALTPIVVEVRDAGGNRVTTYSGSVSLALLTPPAGVTLSGATVAAVAGVATFSSVFVSGTAVGAQLVATATGVPGTATSSAFTVGVRPAVALGFSVQPPAVISALAVFPSSVVVRALDAVGGVVTSYTGIVSLTLDSPPAGVSLQGTTSATAVNGVATFAGLTISAPAASVRIIATGTGITGAFFSSSIVVNTSVNIFAGTPPSTTFTVQRAAASPAPATAQLTASSLQITGLAIGTITYGPGATGWLGASLSVTSTPATLTLTATTSGLPEGTFTANVPITGSGGTTLNYPVTVAVTPLPVTQIVVVTDPAGAASGSSFVTQPVVELRDATNTRVLSATGAITASVSTGAGTLSGTVTRTAVQGRVTYTDLRITGTGAHTLAFNSGVLPQAMSGSFSVAAALSTVQAVAVTTGNIGTPIPSFTPVTASGGVAPYVFTLSGALLPSGMSFNAATGQISGAPVTTLPATTFTVNVTDAALATSSKTFTLTVNGALTTTQVIAAKRGDVGTPIAPFIPVTAGGGTPAISFAVSPATTLKDTGLSFDPVNGAISGTPTGTLVLTTFTVTATDAVGATSSKTFTLTINPALTTTQAISAKVVTSGAPIASFTPVTAAGGAAPITFAVSPAGTLAAVSLTFNSSTGAIAGTPAGTLALTTFTVTATDAIGATSSQTFTLTINPPLNTMQAIASMSGNVSLPLGPLTPVTASGGTAPITFAVSPLAGLTGVGLVFDVNTGALSGTPTGAVGPATFTVTATDAAGATSSKAFSLTVNGPLTTTQLIAAKVGTQGVAIAPFIPVTGAGGTAPIVYSISPAATLTGAGLTFNPSTGAVGGTPTGPLPLTTFTVTATDNIAATSSNTFTLTINSPVTTVQAVAATVGTQGIVLPTFTPVTATGGTAPITFAVSPLASLTGVGLAFDANTGAVSGTPTSALTLTTFTVTATDAAGAASSKTFTLRVNGPLTTTQVIASKVGDNGVAIASFTPVTASGGTAPITFAISPAATLTDIGMSFSTGTGAVSGTPTSALALTTFTVTATDNVGSTSSKTFTLTVNASLTTTQAVAATVGDVGRSIPSFTPVTTAGGTAPVTFALSPAVTLTGIGLSFNTSTGAVSGTPTGTLALTTFTVTATDNVAATSSKTFTLRVNAALTTTQAVASKVGSAGTSILSFTPVTAAGGTAPITFAITPAATLAGIGVSLDGNTGAVSGTPSAPLALTTFTVTATDNIGATSSKTFTLLVNGPLTTTQAVASKVGTQGIAIASFIPVTAAGGTTPIAFGISPAAALTSVGMSFNSSTGAVSGTPTGPLASTTFTVTATDNVGATSSKTFGLIINPPLTTTQAVPAMQGDVGRLISVVTPVTTTGGTAPVTFAISSSSTLTGIGLSFNASTGAVSGTPSGTLGTTTFTVTATDAVGAVSSKTFTLTISPALGTTQAIPVKNIQVNVVTAAFAPVTASGGSAPITFAISPSATLTGTGLTFNTSTGAISGTPTSALSTTTFTVTATDNVGATSAKTFDLQVYTGIVLDVGAAATATTNGGLNVAIPINLDMSGRGPNDLGAITSTITWDATKFSFNAGASAVGSWPGGGLIVGNPGSGSITISGAGLTATTSNFTLYNLVLTANATASTVVSAVNASVSVSVNFATTPIIVTPRNLSVTINP